MKEQIYSIEQKIDFFPANIYNSLFLLNTCWYKLSILSVQWCNKFQMKYCHIMQHYSKEWFAFFIFQSRSWYMFMLGVSTWIYSVCLLVTLLMQNVVVKGDLVWYVFWVTCLMVFLMAMCFYGHNLNLIGFFDKTLKKNLKIKLLNSVLPIHLCNSHIWNSRSKQKFSLNFNIDFFLLKICYKSR